MQQFCNSHWQRNLIICLIGSFSTIFAMTLILPFLPLYVEELGVKDKAAIIQWSGIVYSATFIVAGLIAPVWGRLGDRYGRKSMLVRASLGMAVTMSLMGLVTNIWQLLGLRILIGLAGGYSSGATIMVAVQAPKNRSAWALGIVASGIMAGNLAGPLAGGWLPYLLGIRVTFLYAGALIFMAFLLTVMFIHEPEPSIEYIKTKQTSINWSRLSGKGIIVCMFLTSLLLMVANMSIEPIITVYICTFVHHSTSIIRIAGYTMAATALGSILSASWSGKMADRIGHFCVIIAMLIIAGLLLLPQAYVTAGWQLISLRFLMGIALGGLLPCITAVIRHHVPEYMVGNIISYSVSAQLIGQFTGPLIGGFIGGHVGMRAVFIMTSILLLLGAVINWSVYRVYGVARPSF